MDISPSTPPRQNLHIAPTGACKLLFAVQCPTFSPSLPRLGQQTDWWALTVKTNQVPLYSLSQPIRVSSGLWVV